jgi:ADP-ribose pyrophosphatase
MAAAKMEHLGGFYLAPGYSTEYMNVYLATDLQHDPLEADADEFLSVESLPVAEALALCDHGKILDAKTLAAFSLARLYLK